MPRFLLRSASLIGAVALVPAVSAALAAVDVDTYKELDQFMSVFERVRSEYVDKVDDQTLIRGAIDGMLSSLDPHSAYLDARDFQNLRTQTEGSYGGLGLTVSMEDGAVKVIAPTEDSPGDRAGIKAGDYITHLDNQLIFGGTLDEAVDKMRGRPGTKITLTIVRPGRDKPLDVTLQREIIQLRPVKWEIKDKVGIININSFSKVTGEGVRAALMAIDKATGGRPLGYVIDLRSNPGGLLDQAIEVSDAFLERGEIVSQRGRDSGDIERYFARAGDLAHGLPVIVLVDAGSASAAEIVAGALQDQRR
ncbi:MAG: S41 family peptidase, partial [Sphingomonadaceae bacterium]